MKRKIAAISAVLFIVFIAIILLLPRRNGLFHIDKGMHKNKVHEMLGLPDIITSGFYSEIFTLVNGTTIQVLYNGEDRVEELLVTCLEYE